MHRCVIDFSFLISILPPSKVLVSALLLSFFFLFFFLLLSLSLTLSSLVSLLSSDCVYDDLDHMGKELDKWKQENSNSLAALEREQDITADMLRPLREELETMDQQHRDQLATLHTLQAQVLKNDVAIAAALEMHVTGTLHD